MKTVFALGAIVALTMISPAAAGPTACPINEAVSRLEAYYIRARGEIASKEKPLLNEQSAINDQAKNPNMPIGSQLRPDQLARFDEINRQMLALRAKDAALSGYVRDAGAIVKLANVALGVRRGFKYPDNSPDHFYSQYVLALAGLSDNQGGLDPTDVKDGECSIDSGLYVLQHVEVGQTDLSKVKATLERVMAIAKRYHIDPTNSKYIEGSGPDWIERIPVIADKQQVRRDVMAVQDGVAGVTYVQVMQDLRGLHQAALSQYWGYINDVDHLPDGADLAKAFGQTWSRPVATGDFRLKFYDTILQQVAAAIPSDTMMENQQLSNAAKNAQ